MMITMVLVGISVAALFALASMRGDSVAYAYAHMAVALATASYLAVVGIVEAQRRQAEGQTATRISSVLARQMAWIWGWGALALIASYGSGVVTWKEWPGFAAAFAVFGIVAVVMWQRLENEAGAGAAERGTSTIYRWSRYLGMAQTGGMALVMVGLAVDGKMTRFLEIQRTGWQDWAANNVFFFGALGLFLLSLYGLRTLPKEPQTA